MLVSIVYIMMYMIVYIVSEFSRLIGMLCCGFLVLLVVVEIVLKLMQVKNMIVVVWNMLFQLNLLDMLVFFGMNGCQLVGFRCVVLKLMNRQIMVILIVMMIVLMKVDCVMLIYSRLVMVVMMSIVGRLNSLLEVMNLFLVYVMGVVLSVLGNGMFNVVVMKLIRYVDQFIVIEVDVNRYLSIRYQLMNQVMFLLRVVQEQEYVLLDIGIIVVNLVQYRLVRVQVKLVNMNDSIMVGLVWLVVVWFVSMKILVLIIVLMLSMMRCLVVRVCFSVGLLFRLFLMGLLVLMCGVGVIGLIFNRDFSMQCFFK